jgi:hypothetical protein
LRGNCQLAGLFFSALRFRVRKIISSDQLAELAGVIEMLSESEAGEDMKQFHILIDKLDEHWVDVSIRFKLIRSLIESLKSFRRITNLLVALRSDVLERVTEDARIRIHPMLWGAFRLQAG